VEIRSFVDVISTYTAMVERDACEDHVRAKVVGAARAVMARGAGHAGFNGHAVAFLEGGNIIADPFNNSSTFVAEDIIFRYEEVALAPVMPEMEIGASRC
jgi:hypothetical protein